MPVLLVATADLVAAVYAPPADVADPAYGEPIRVDWGDGSLPVGTVLGSVGANVAHGYGLPGDYTIVATGRTPDGDPWSYSLDVTMPSDTLDVDMIADAIADQLPADGPATVAGAKVGTPADADRVQAICDAVNAQVRTWPTAARSRGLASWWAPTVEGANMLVRRLWRRKDTPGGVEVFGDAGIAYVRRLDPDVAQLLELGDWSRPAVG